MALIPEGEFEMGSNTDKANDDERPVHAVYVDAFYMDTHEVTVGEYRRFVQETGHRAPDWDKVSRYSPTDEHPIVFVSWHNAMTYAKCKRQAATNRSGMGESRTRRCHPAAIFLGQHNAGWKTVQFC